MPSPFPGMDPYLETPDLWPDVHHGLISQIQAVLNPLVRPRYVARVELRVYISDDDDPGREAIIPDVRIEKAKRKSNKKSRATAAVAVVEPLIIPFLIDDEIEEARIEVRHLETGALVTLIEVLSPTNKIRGARGRQSFMAKRQETLASDVHWVEIDLLRAGVPSVTRPPLVPSDYRIVVSRSGKRNKARYWPVSVRQPLPVIGVPLRSPDADVPLDLGGVLQAAYDRGAYDVSIDYRQEPDPPLSTADVAWADQLLRQKRVRR
jgi:hypothetical protein